MNAFPYRRVLRASRWLMAPLALLAAAPVRAQISERDVERQKVQIDPQQGYVFLRTPGRLAGTFLRVPDEQSLADYRAGRAAALAEAQEDYARRLRAYERRQADPRFRRNEDPPQEPTEATLPYPPFHAGTARSFGPMFVYSQDETSPLAYSYLTMLPPGRYVWYGPVKLDPQQGYLGTCFCMGSVQFDVKAGEITDLGNFLSAAPQVENHPVAPSQGLSFSGALTGTAVELSNHSSEVRFGLPASLAGWPSRPAEFVAVGKMNNIYGVRISRLAPVPGVLGYRRDTVIDERTGGELPPFVIP